QARSPGEVNHRTLLNQGDGNAVGTGFVASIDKDGRFPFTRVTRGAGLSRRSMVSVVHRRPHIAFPAGNGAVAVDGPLLGGEAAFGGLNQVNGAGIGGGVGVQTRDHMDGWIAAVAVWASGITNGARIRMREGYQKLNGFRSDEQIAWAMLRAGGHSKMWAFDEGTGLLGAAATEGRDAPAGLAEGAGHG